MRVDVGRVLIIVAGSVIQDIGKLFLEHYVAVMMSIMKMEVAMVILGLDYVLAYQSEQSGLMVSNLVYIYLEIEHEQVEVQIVNESV
ncbi:hypothetical protein J6T66_00990 [bacterium]|nr:hypothetical protein [bacterium]